MPQSGKEVRFTRQELYEQVWERPASHIARDHGLLPKAITDACRMYDIPRPSSGYWTQRDFGKQVPRVPLPPKPDGEEVIILSSVGTDAATLKEPAPPRTDPPRVGQESVVDEVAASPDAVEVLEREGLSISKPAAGKSERLAAPAPVGDDAIVVPELLTRPHPLVKRAGKNLRGAKEDHRGHLVPKEQPCLDVRVTRGSLNRALRIMDTLIKALERQRFRVELVEGEPVKTQVTVNGETLSIWIEEKVSRREKPLPPAEQRKKDRDPHYYYFRQYIYVPTGMLTLRLDGDVGWDGTRQSWADGKRQTVEERLDSFIAGLIEAAGVVRQRREKREQEAREWEERRRRAQELARLKQEETARIEQLDREVNGWQRAQRIREYVAAVRRVWQDSPGTAEEEEKRAQWVEWALQQADRVDPLRESPSSVLDEPDPKGFYW